MSRDGVRQEGGTVAGAVLLRFPTVSGRRFNSVLDKEVLP